MGSAQLRAAILFGLLLITCFGQFNQRGVTRYDARINPFLRHHQQQQEQYQQQLQQQQQYQEPRNLDSSTAGNGIICPEPNGRFPVPTQCDAYIECIKGVGEEKLCPEGLLFNPDARFNYPCGYPIDVQCLGRSALQSPQPTEECPHQYGYFKIGDRQNCGQFMNCVEGRSYVFNCPEGLAYNSETYRCDWPDQVPDCDAEAFLGFTCPNVNQNQFFSFETRFFKSPTDCQRYYICVENRPRLQNCGEGHAFNELINACDAAENVTGCEPQTFNTNLQLENYDNDQQNYEQNYQQNRGSFNQQQNRELFNQQQNRELFNQQQNRELFNQQQNTRSSQYNYKNDQQNRYTSRRF